MRYTNQQENEILEIIRQAAQKKDLLRDFLRDILTPAEYRELVTRWQIIKNLEDGLPQREIARKLGVALATITRGTRELSDPNGGFRKLLGKLKN